MLQAEPGAMTSRSPLAIGRGSQAALAQANRSAAKMDAPCQLHVTFGFMQPRDQEKRQSEGCTSH